MELTELLTHRGIEFRKTNNPSEILISCSSGEHVDKSPSLSYKSLIPQPDILSLLKLSVCLTIYMFLERIV